MKMQFLILGIISFIVIVVVIWWTSIINTEVRLRNRFDSQFNDVETAHDVMWKTISQQYQVQDKYRETFIDGINALAAGRSGGSVFKSTTEASSQLGLPSDIFQDLMATIEGKRDQLKRAQDELTDIWREHKSWCEVFPNSMLIGSKVLPKPAMISSTDTKSAVENKIDDNVELGS